MGAGTPTGGMPQQSQPFGGQANPYVQSSGYNTYKQQQASNLYPPPPQPGMNNPFSGPSQTTGQGMSQAYPNPYAPQQSQSQQAPNYLSQLYNTYGQQQQFAAQSAPPMQPQGMMPPQPQTGGPGQQPYAPDKFNPYYDDFGRPGTGGPNSPYYDGRPPVSPLEPADKFNPYYDDFGRPGTGGPGAYQMDPRTGRPYYGDYNSDGTMQEVGSTRFPDRQPRTGGPGIDGYVDETGNPMQPLTGGPGQQQNPYQNPYQDFSPTAVQAQDQLQQMLARQAGQQSGLGAIQQHYGFAINPYMPPPPPPTAPAAVAPTPVVAPRLPPPQQQEEARDEGGGEPYIAAPQTREDQERNYGFMREVARQEHFGLDTPGGGYQVYGGTDPTNSQANQDWLNQYEANNPRNFRRGGLAALRYR